MGGSVVNLAEKFLSSFPGAAAPSRAGGVPQGEPLCGYHTPSSGCSGLKDSVSCTFWTLTSRSHTGGKTDGEADRHGGKIKTVLPGSKHDWDLNEKKTDIALIQYHDYVFSH